MVGVRSRNMQRMIAYLLIEYSTPADVSTGIKAAFDECSLRQL